LTNGNENTKAKYNIGTSFYKCLAITFKYNQVQCQKRKDMLTKHSSLQHNYKKPKCFVFNNACPLRTVILDNGNKEHVHSTHFLYGLRKSNQSILMSQIFIPLESQIYGLDHLYSIVVKRYFSLHLLTLGFQFGRQAEGERIDLWMFDLE